MTFGRDHYYDVADELNTEVLRLRAVNANLLEALVNLLFAPTTAAQDAAREAVEEARK